MADDDVRLTLLADFRLAQTTTDPQSAVAGALRVCCGLREAEVG